MLPKRRILAFSAERDDVVDEQPSQSKSRDLNVELPPETKAFLNDQWFVQMARTTRTGDPEVDAANERKVQWYAIGVAVFALGAFGSLIGTYFRLGARHTRPTRTAAEAYAAMRGEVAPSTVGSKGNVKWEQAKLLATRWWELRDRHAARHPFWYPERRE